jgi:release factor glutamine methyltransferase
MRNFIKKITHPFLKYGLKLFYSKPRNYCYDTICIKVHPDVFPPHLTLSTKILLDFINPLDLKEKRFLELGCGSGIISLVAAKKEAKVIATDINETALEYLKLNASKNNLEVDIVKSNLFEKLENHTFDYIIINPPYYPKNAKNTKEKAWFCGENFEYFENLFFQLPNFINENTFCYMIVSEDCEIATIKKIGVKNKLNFQLVLQKKSSFEKNYIFQINKT